jgi:hypothetical protein
MSVRVEKHRSVEVPNIPACVSLINDKDVKISNRIYSFCLQNTWNVILIEIAIELEKSHVFDRLVKKWTGQSLAEPHKCNLYSKKKKNDASQSFSILYWTLSSINVVFNLRIHIQCVCLRNFSTPHFEQPFKLSQPSNWKHFLLVGLFNVHLQDDHKSFALPLRYNVAIVLSNWLETSLNLLGIRNT